jgi:tryptophan synthase alpha subunit
MTANFILSLAFLKTKLLLDLMRLDAATTTLGSKFPRETLDLILLGVPLSNAVTDNRAIMDSNDRSANITNLSSQLDMLYAMAHKQNQYF